LLRMPSKVLCLDWDTRKLRVLAARVGRGGMELSAAHRTAIPDGVDINDASAMGSLIADVLKEHNLSQKRVIVDVPRDKAVITRLKMPPTPHDELASAVRYQAMRELPFPIEQASVDYVATDWNENGLTTEVLLAGVLKQHLDVIREICYQAGLTPIRIGLRPLANAISVRQQREWTDKNVLFVDVGPSSTEIDVIKGGRLELSRVVNVLVQDPGRDTQAGDDLQLPGDEATTFEVNPVNDLVVEVTRSLQAFRATDPDIRIDGIIVGGRTGVEGELRDALSGQFQLETVLFDPTKVLRLDDPEDGKRLQAFSAALGLAWGLSRDGMLELDFLNPKKPIIKAEVLKARARRIMLASVAVLVLAVGSWGYYSYQKQAELSELERAISEVKKESGDRIIIETQLARIRERPEPVWLDSLVDIVEAFQSYDESVKNAKPPKPGEKLLLDEINFDEKSALIAVRLSANSMEDVERFREALNGIVDEEGNRRYWVRSGYTWDASNKGSEGFRNAVTLEIDCEALIAEHQEIRSREKKRKKTLQPLIRKS
jgi:type IV pilus assembly protein PilM